MRDALRLKEATVGLKADLPKCGQVAQTLSDVEVACVVDSRLRAEGLTFLVVLLDSRALIVDVQRGNHAIGNDPSAETPGSGFGHAPIEDQLDLLGTADIQVFANHILEENPAADRTVQHLSQGQLDLQDRDLVSVSGLSVSGRKGVGQSTEPFSKEDIDLVGG